MMNQNAAFPVGANAQQAGHFTHHASRIIHRCSLYDACYNSFRVGGRFPVYQFVQSVDVGATACDHNIGVRSAPGVDVVAAPDTNRHVGEGVNSFGHSLNVELDQFVFQICDSVDGAVHGVHWPGSMTRIGQFAALRVFDPNGSRRNQIVAAGDLNVQQFIRLIHAAMLVRNQNFQIFVVNLLFAVSHIKEAIVHAVNVFFGDGKTEFA